jgi:hypothetical protein
MVAPDHCAGPQLDVVGHLLISEAGACAFEFEHAVLGHLIV